MFTIVSLFFLITILISIALWLVWRRHHQDSSSAQNPVVSFTDWVSGTFDTWQGRPKGVEAAVQVLLPIAAVAFGLTAIGIVLRIVASGIR
jgi:Ca2+/Na+ antiporter